MSKAVLISIRPKWCELIASGKKSIEVRKTRPKLEPPFKCYIYQTLPKSGDWNDRDGRVIGEFVCDGIQDITYCDDGEHQHYQWIDAPKWAFFLNQEACMNDEELKKYLGNKDGYGWHISDLVIYDEPIKLSDLHSDCSQCGYVNARWTNCDFIIERQPQSWCYVEELS